MPPTAAVPEWLSAVRSLRPAHAVNALGRHPELLLLNPRDLRTYAHGPLARLEVPLGVMLPGVFRAARDAGAAIGIVKPGAMQGEGPPPAAFAQAVFRAAEEVGFTNPFFLSTVPLALTAADTTGEHLRAEVQRYLDAGFTEVVVSAGELSAREVGTPLRTGLESAKEREVSIAGWSASEEGGLDLHAVLVRNGVQLDLLSLGADLPPDRVAHVLDLIRPAGLELHLGASTGVGLGGLDASAVMQAAARSFVSGEVGPDRFRELSEADVPTRERIEALLYADLLGVLQAGALRGTGARALSGLATRPVD